MNNNPSLCIPRIFDNVNRRDIQTIFDKLDLGKISRIDVIERKTEKGQSYKRVFIHFYNWYTNDNSEFVRNRIISGKDVKIVHNEPWFWKVSAYTPPAKPAGGKRRKSNEQVISEFQKIHTDENNNPIYEYDLVEYSSTHTKVKIRCKK